MTELSHLFSPITIGNQVIRNRILQSAHITGYVENGLPSDRHVRYYEARAKGGIGLIIQEATIVSPESGYHPKIISEGWRDEIVPRLKKISDAVHAHGAKIFCQLAHGGSVCGSFFNWSHVQSCSDIPNAGIGEVPVAMDKKTIDRVVRQHVETALRVKEGGYDGVELHFAHGYLQQQFLSPYSNIRKDEYGGSLENRMRFGLRIIDAVRQAVGDDFVVGLRMSADELLPGGYTLEDAKGFAAIWEQTGKIDFFHVTVAASTTMAFAIPPMMVPPRPFVYCATEIKQIVDKPVFAVIRINDPVTADAIIANHEADMVTMTRATLCDPDMPNKARQGRVEDIRQCIACNEGCWERLLTHLEPITCMQNPEAGREGVFKILPARDRKKVVVVGGGCAGMEAAIVAKKRGHDVVLYEKAQELGGAALISAKAPNRQDVGQVTRFLSHEIKQLGVDVHLNTKATPEMIMAASPDVVVVATGGVAIAKPVSEAVGPSQAIEIEDGAHVVTAEDVLNGTAETGERVVIADQQHYLKGMATAELLADQGKTVSLVMPLPIRYITANPYDVDHITLGVMTMNLKMKKVNRISDCMVKKAVPGRVTIKDVYTEEIQEIDADTLVLSYWRKAEDGLYTALEGKVKELYKIGDALAPRRMINAIYDGYKTAMEL